MAEGHLKWEDNNGDLRAVPALGSRGFALGSRGKAPDAQMGLGFDPRR